MVMDLSAGEIYGFQRTLMLKNSSPLKNSIGTNILSPIILASAASSLATIGVGTPFTLAVLAPCVKVTMFVPSLKVAVLVA